MVISVLAVFLAIAYAPWMASFTETVEKRNPALTATGLAVWGWIIRVVIAISVLILPSVISSMTPLVTYGTQAATIAATYPQQLATLAVIDPGTQAAMGANPADTAAQAKAVGDIPRRRSTSPRPPRPRGSSASPRYPRLTRRSSPSTARPSRTRPLPRPDSGGMRGSASAGTVLFLPFITVMTGRCSSRKAREDAEEHDRLIQQELAALEHS